MGLEKLTLAMLNVRDYQGMKDFYAKTLGLEVTEAHDEGQWATFKLHGGGAEIAIHGGLEGSAPRAEAYPQVVPCIEVEDIKATVEDLRTKGVEIYREVHETMPGLKLADFKDPEGNVFNLYESAGGTHGI